ncbi:MAG: hypothetical protein ABL971_11545 [Vicinamibacterales bacterium]
MIDQLAGYALKPETLCRTERVDLRDSLLLSEIDWPVLEGPSNVECVNRIRPPWHTDASGALLLLDRAAYHRLRGFNEVYRVGLGTLNAQKARYQERPDLAPWGDIRWNSEVIYENRDDWGIAAAPQRQVSTGIHYLDFDWTAVPTLSDLKRIHLAPSRVGLEPRSGSAGLRARIEQAD